MSGKLYDSRVQPDGQSLMLEVSTIASVICSSFLKSLLSPDFLSLDEV